MSKRRKPKSPTRAQQPSPDDSARYFEGALWNDVTGPHWALANGLNVNIDIIHGLWELGRRLTHEARNSDLLKGVMNSHCVGVVGKAGPRLQVSSDNDEYSHALEHVFNDLWAPRCDVNGRHNLASFCKLWLRGNWTRGAGLAQLVAPDDDTFPGPKIHNIGVERVLRAPQGAATMLYDDGLQILGLHISDTGKLQAAYIAPDDNYWINGNYQGTWVDSENLLHVFPVTEDGQVHGIPLASAFVETGANLRDYRKSVLDVAALQTWWGAYMTCKDPTNVINGWEGGSDLTGMTLPMARRQALALPPGLDVNFGNPNQPTTTYREYIDHEESLLGYGVGMPGVVVRKSSSDANYSSARLDMWGFIAACQEFHEMFECCALNKLAEQVEVYATLLGLLPRKGNSEPTHFTWLWPEPPFNDPQDMAKKDAVELANGTTTLARIASRRQEDWKKNLELAARIKNEREALGLPPYAWEQPPKPAIPAKDTAEEAPEEPPKGKKP